MLEIRNLTKVYKPKRGMPVTALNDVSLVFPQTGMVFLLGKSGSGKSTLLNVLGGLDRCNSGDIIIQGKSTKSFRQSHFDSYRNTYVGFIFQEYNILEEFSVGANIALALQLQGLKPDSQRVNEILRQVDLDGYGNRKPNELSGGQKQRVAIARALVKNPKIIMADEPTGALDSATGRQILTTLKKLSRDKLVIVVSHDREFAEQYADRIIELSDGRVIRDVERRGSDLDMQQAVPVYMEDSVSLPENYELTLQDKNAICDYIQKMLRQEKEPKFTLLGKNDGGFQPTDTGNIRQSQEGYKLIKSRLPLSYAFRLGASGLKHKKFRLVMTILLSCIALVLFGLADTFASYDYVNTSVSSLVDDETHVTYASFEKEVYYGDPEDEFSYTMTEPMSEEDVEQIRRKTDLEVYPVYRYGADESYPYIGEHFYGDVYGNGLAYYSDGFGGFIEVDEKVLEAMDARLMAGQLPREGTNDVAVSEFILEAFRDLGYRETYDGQRQTIKKAEDLIGKPLRIGETEYTICGIVDTDIDLSRYEELQQLDSDDLEQMEFVETMGYMVLQTELRYSLNYSLSGLAMVAPGHARENLTGIYQTLSPMPQSERRVRELVEFTDSIREDSQGQDVQYSLMNPVSFELRNLDMVFKVVRKVFLWVGLAFVLFASLLFSNFIATSISYKKQQIGILRAIGSRSNDVFRIFFAESFCIAMINFVLSLAGTVAISAFINTSLKNSTGMLLTVLNVGLRQGALLFGVCILVAAVASFLPVRAIAAKRPIDAIRDR